jgi:putative DNA primase/helicase
LRLADVAAIWVNSGVSVTPIKPDQTKRPSVRWGEFQVKAPTIPLVEEWWGNGQQYGLALICGAVSGNLEMLELEGRGCTATHLTEIQNRMDEAGIGHIWDLLNGPSGYSEMSPSGGVHLLYRITDHKVPGNSKIAKDEDGLVLCETRGEGGYVIVAPTSGLCHPTGEPWMLISGQYGVLPELTWYERCQLHEALRSALDCSPEPAPTTLPAVPEVPAALPSSPRTGSSAAVLTPGDDFEQRTEWIDILGPHGWTLEADHGRELHWTRPGKDRRQGMSATTGHAEDRNRLYVFSSNTEFRQEVPYTKFGAYTLLNHGGDFHAAAAALRAQGYGGVGPSSELQPWVPGDTDIQQVPFDAYDMSDAGNSQHLHNRIKGSFRYLLEEKSYICWDGVQWSPDQRFRVEFEFTTMALELSQEASRAGNEVWAKWWVRARNQARTEAAVKGLRKIPGFTVTVADLNHDHRVLNLKNGIFDLMTAELIPHDPDRMMTRTMGVSYDPQATCPRFESFMSKVLPDEAMRAYVQRALGYSLLGDADQRSLFLVCGPSGTGKSTLMAIMEMVFGDYGLAAPSGTLRANYKEQSGPSLDLHMLRGRRFVSTSETNEHTAYNEDLIKRLTGRDTIQSRSLYESFQAWSPVCTLWLATNHPPKFSSDDDALWRRVKILPFNTVLLGEGEVADYAHNVLRDERNGIFTWLIAGLRQYLIHGLGEPEEVQQAARETRLQTDSVARYVEDQVADGILVQDQTCRIRSSELYQMYSMWARTMGERPLGNRRFSNRIQVGFPELELIRVQGNYFWTGLGRALTASVLGTFQARVD